MKYLLRILLNGYSSGSQVKVAPSSGHIFHARSCVRRDYPSEVTEIVSFYEKWSHVSQGVAGIPFHHHVMSDDVDDIQDPRHHISRPRL